MVLVRRLSAPGRGRQNRDKDYLRVDDHDLAFLAVWTGCAVQEHWLGIGDDEVECANLLLPILEWDVS